MKLVVLFAICVCILPQVLGSILPNKELGHSHLQKSNLAGIDLCGPCVDLLDDTLGDILDAILEIGVGGTCEGVCGRLNSSVETGICELLCVSVGFYEFTKILSNDDLDPIWLCQELLACPMNHCTQDCMDIVHVNVTPHTAPVRTTFVFTVEFNVLNDTGTGVTIVVVTAPDQNQFEVGTLNEGYKPGHYVTSVPFATDVSDWYYPPGKYHAEIAVCGSDCTDAHGVIFAHARTDFEMTPRT